VDRRHSVIKAHELGAWFAAVNNLVNDPVGRNREMIRDFLLLALFTGLRREEAASLSWENVDLKAKTLTIPDPKNRQPHVLPLSDFLFELLTRRHQEISNASRFVFPGDRVKGYLNAPEKQNSESSMNPGLLLPCTTYAVLLSPLPRAWTFQPMPSNGW
jgi:integrase